MKKFCAAFLALLLTTSGLFAQTVNWATDTSQTPPVPFPFGTDVGPMSSIRMLFSVTPPAGSTMYGVRVFLMPSGATKYCLPGADIVYNNKGTYPYECNMAVPVGSWEYWVRCIFKTAGTPDMYTIWDDAVHTFTSSNAGWPAFGGVVNTTGQNNGGGTISVYGTGTLTTGFTLISASKLVVRKASCGNLMIVAGLNGFVTNGGLITGDAETTVAPSFRWRIYSGGLPQYLTMPGLTTGVSHVAYVTNAETSTTLGTYNLANRNTYTP